MTKNKANSLVKPWVIKRPDTGNIFDYFKISSFFYDEVLKLDFAINEIGQLTSGFSVNINENSYENQSLRIQLARAIASKGIKKASIQFLSFNDGFYIFFSSYEQKLSDYEANLKSLNNLRKKIDSVLRESVEKKLNISYRYLNKFDLAKLVTSKVAPSLKLNDSDSLGIPEKVYQRYPDLVGLALKEELEDSRKSISSAQSFKHDGIYSRVLSLRSWPKVLNFNDLEFIHTLDIKAEISQNIHILDQAPYKELIGKKSSSERLPVAKRNRALDVSQNLEGNLSTGDQIMLFSYHIIIHEKDEKSLVSLSNEITRLYNEKGYQLVPENHQHHKFFFLNLPGAANMQKLLLPEYMSVIAGMLPF